MREREREGGRERERDAEQENGGRSERVGRTFITKVTLERESHE